METIIAKLTKAPILMAPRFGEAFILDTDASSIALGACLQQHDEEGLLRPIAYASRKCTATEKRYSAIELEALGVVYALKEFRAYLEGGPETLIRTDNAPLCSILKRKDLEGRLAVSCDPGIRFDWSTAQAHQIDCVTILVDGLRKHKRIGQVKALQRTKDSTGKEGSKQALIV